MATKYSLDVLDAETRVWTSVALFSNILPIEVLADMGRTMWNNVDGAEDVAVIDLDTGEVVWYYTADAWQDEPDNCDDDCGFDPYMGCYTDDI